MSRSVLARPRNRADAYLGLVAFITLAAWLPIVASGLDAYAMPAFALLGLGAFAPSAAAVALSLACDGREASVRLLRSVVAWRRISRTALAIAAGALLVVPVAALCAGLVGSPVVLRGGGLGSTVAALSLAVLMGPLNEEAGWTGWLDPALRGFLPGPGALAVGSAARLAWHLPLFAMVGTDQRAAAFVPFALGIVALHVLAVSATRASRGAVAGAVLVHAAWNAGIALIPLSGTAYALRGLGALCIAAVALRTTDTAARTTGAALVTASSATSTPTALLPPDAIPSERRSQA